VDYAGKVKTIMRYKKNITNHYWNEKLKHRIGHGNRL